MTSPAAEALMEKLAKERIIHEQVHDKTIDRDLIHPTPNEIRHARWWVSTICEQLHITESNIESGECDRALLALLEIAEGEK